MDSPLTRAEGANQRDSRSAAFAKESRRPPPHPLVSIQVDQRFTERPRPRRMAYTGSPRRVVRRTPRNSTCISGALVA